ncbi:MAG: TetR/AcrR family transcriptional regulator [Rhodococcus sp. (in: high G+C Gram-positive bacteria)]|uniref:TetR/AcrR family transcriptional regulator n=1 Tax=unclassified Rhodococcus (in: high G+C Gram-positive bacteria) TaxID=192944 RepID=UPI000EF87686|nr:MULTISPECIES: TetR/AcrR family transcriptional regulator [unclassified Rhodococcus (in: high G+C Gram-positive bacteria)]RMB79209.1 TetR/AcrR family transcriptional regulator [Rhodococcus sp. SBT000017]
MTRYGREHKAVTRRRILESAGKRLKVSGIDGSGVASLMGDAGLTTGAFYAHFDSKDDLVVEVVKNELESQRSELNALPTGPEGVAAFLRNYLSALHRDDPAQGCVSAALLDEIARGSDTTRDAYSTALIAVIDDLADAAAAASGTPTQRVDALSALALMAGTVQVARSLTDTSLSDAVLDAGLRNAAAILNLKSVDLTKSGAASASVDS